jgi:heptosyltransferase-3
MRRKIESWGRNTLASTLGKAFGVHPTSEATLKAEWDQGRIQKLLLVRPHQGLGDLILATPMFRALKKSRPGMALHFLADTYNPLAVQGNPHLDKIWAWQKKTMYSPVAALTFIRALRAERYDLAIIISSHTPSFNSFLLARFSGARHVLAYDTRRHYEGANWSRTLADVEVPEPPEGTPEWVTFMNLVRPLGVDGSFEPEFYVSPADTAWAQERWKEYPVQSGQPIVGLYLGGNPDRPERLWSAENFATLARQLLDRNISVIAIVPPPGLISGSRREEPGIYEDFSRILGRTLPAFSDRSLTKVAAFLSNLDLFVCPDGGLMHIAIASRVRTLGLCFETDPDRWVAPVAWANGLRAPDARNSGLSPDTVRESILNALHTSIRSAS